MCSVNYSRTSYLYSVLTIVENSCLCSVLATVETPIYVHFNYSRNLLFLFSVNYRRKCCLCAVLTTVQPLVSVQF